MTDERAAQDPATAEHHPGTGVLVVDEALARLTALEGRPIEEHPAVFEAVHGSLRAVLGSDGA